MQKFKHVKAFINFVRICPGDSDVTDGQHASYNVVFKEAPSVFERGLVASNGSREARQL